LPGAEILLLRFGAAFAVILLLRFGAAIALEATLLFLVAISYLNLKIINAKAPSNNQVVLGAISGIFTGLGGTGGLSG
jgi:hypothetical protein